ncbi:MAG TPA: GAF domain-containing protein [Saprospiraceae bacterium]|nr:GAF domain-containing protein [Saprospiraceae bacterium]
MNTKVTNVGRFTAELPFRMSVSFQPLFDYWREIAADPDPLKSGVAQTLLKKLAGAPELAKPFDDYTLLEKYADEIKELFAPLFPEPLQTNEIKALSMPFTGYTFNPTRRFQKIQDRAGSDYQWKMSDFDVDQVYVTAAIAVLNTFYNAGIDYKRPFYFDMPDTVTGISRRYRAFFNADFVTFHPNELTRPLAADDIRLLTENFHDIALWKTKIPPNSYDFEGFGLISLFDVTEEEALSSMKNSLLQKHALQSKTYRQELSMHMQAYLNLKDVEVGFASFDETTKKVHVMGENDPSCFTVTTDGILDSSDCFCDISYHEVFDKHGMYIVSDVTKFAHKDSPLIDRMRNMGIRSFIVAPLMYDEKVVGFLEVASETIGVLNSVVASKLGNILPMYTVAMQRALDERETQLEAIVQEKFTALHPSVAWRFFEVAENVLNRRAQNLSDPMDEVVFRDVVPLYGQFDIRGSSTARNEAIQADLIKQLCHAESVMDAARNTNKLPIYDHLRFRIQKYRKELQNGINAGDEVKILDFLKSEIYPVFNHLSAMNPELEKVVLDYMQSLDPELHVVYEERKRYESSVTQINEFVSALVETEQAKAQGMYPHYFEKYKTDGVEYNLYMGQSLQPVRPYDPLYLRNLRLWQLLLTAHVENRIHTMQATLPMKLEITSLILAHNSPLSIKFRQDEKKFDVDGAYNIRYEIMKKRIDKAYVKNTQERATQPGKIVIVYSQDEEATEYTQYLEYLRALGVVQDRIERLELEDLQGTSGLKALRVDLIYSDASTLNLAEIYDKQRA